MKFSALAFGLCATQAQQLYADVPVKSNSKKPTSDASTKKDNKIAIPGDCTSWFDGCNTCEVKDSEIKSCTDQVCFQHGQPKCLSKNKPFSKEELSTCSVWFNGCDDCVVEHGEIKKCSSKNRNCEQPSRAFCK